MSCTILNTVSNPYDFLYGLINTAKTLEVSALIITEAGWMYSTFEAQETRKKAAIADRKIIDFM